MLLARHEMKMEYCFFKFQKMKVEFLKVQDINYQTSPDSLIWVLMSLLEVRT